MNKQLLTYFVVCGASFGTFATNYMFSPEGMTYHAGVAQAGSVVDDISNSYWIQVPDDKYAKVTLLYKGSKWGNCESASCKAYLNGSRRINFGETIELSSSSTISISVSAVADFSCNPYNISGYFTVAGGRFPDYYPTYPRYSNYYAKWDYSISASYEKKLPDLYVSSASVSSSAVAVDEAATISFRLGNRGRLNTGTASIVRIYDGQRKIGDDLSIGVLAVDATSSHQVTLPKLSAGNHVLRIVADSTGLINESSEANNEATVSLRVYKRTAVEVAFNLNGGGDTIRVPVIAGSLLGQLPTINRFGYVFSGWWTEMSGGTQVTSLEKITQARTFYAHWTAKTTIIEFNRRYGSGGTRSARATYESDLPMVSVPTRKGYDFGGYWTALDGDGTQYYTSSGHGAVRWNVDADRVVLYAKWTPRVVSLSLDSQGGTGGSVAMNAHYLDTLPDVVPPSRSGWVFQGYFLEQGGKGKQLYDSQGLGTGVCKLTADTMLYAHWLPTKKDYLLTLDLQGGSGDTSITATYGANMPQIVPPTRPRHVFKGYFSAVNGGGTKYYNADGSSASNWDSVTNSRLYASWERAYHVVFDANGGVGGRKEQYFTNECWELEQSTFTSNGYVVAGWALSPDGAPIFPERAIVGKDVLKYGDDPDAEEVTLYAAWGKRIDVSLPTIGGLSLVTGGKGGDSGWRDVGNQFRSAPRGGMSWVCAMTEDCGHLSFGCTNAGVNRTRFDFSFFSDGHLYTNSCLNGVRKELSALSGRHLATWSFCKDLEAFGENVDLGDHGSTDDDAVLLAIVDEKDAQVAILQERVVQSAVGIVGKKASEDSVRSAVEEAFADLRAGKAIGYLYSHVATCVNKICKTNKLLTALSNYRDSAEVQEFIGYCKSVVKLMSEMDAIEHYVASFGVISDVSWKRTCLVGFVEADGVDHERVKDAYSAIQANGLAYEDLEGTVCPAAVDLLAPSSTDFTDTKRSACRTMIWQCFEDYYNGANSGSVLDILSARISSSGLELKTSAFYNALNGRIASTDEERRLGKIVKSVIATAQRLVDEKNALRDYISRCGVMTIKMVEADTSIGSLPSPRARAGYTFRGWVKKVDGLQIDARTIISDDVFFFESWSTNTYTVSFNANGGTGVDQQLKMYGEVLGELPVPLREGYVFEGWYGDANGDSAFEPDSIVTKNLDLYAKWTKVYDPIEVLDSSAIKSGAAVDWGEESSDEEEAPVVMTVTFNANGGLLEGETSLKQSKAKGKAFGTLPVPTRSGHVFAGWYTAKSGGTKVTAETVVTEDMTLYARWTAAWTVTLNANGGTVGSQGAASPTVKLSVAKGKAVGTLPVPAKAGYAFKGWYTKKSGGTKITTKTKVTKNVTWYAQWTVRKYAVKVVKVGKGTVSGAGNKAYKSKVTLKAKAASGYVFQGWYLDDVLKSRKTSYAVTVPLDGVTYTAKFITKVEDRAGIGMAFGGVGFGAMADGGGLGETALPAMTNVCGVVTTWPVAASGLTAVSVSVSGQPKGMKYDVTKKAVTGVATAASKSGTMKITVKSAGASRTWSVKWRTVALPAWAVGTFKGTLYDGEGEGAASKGTVTLTVGKTGKISGKFVDTKKKAYSFAAASFKTFEDGVLRAQATMKYGTKNVMLDIAVGSEEKTGVDGSATTIGFAEVGSAAAPFGGATAQLAK